MTGDGSWLSWSGYLLFLILSGGVGLPPVFLILPAAGIWPFPQALLLSLLGGLGASVLGFMLARFGLRERVAAKIPPKILRFEQRLESHAFSTVIVLRLLFYLFPPINWMLGISRIPLRMFVPATLLGMLPATLLYLWAGKGLIAFLFSLSPYQSLLLLSAALTGLLLWGRWVVKSK